MRVFVAATSLLPGYGGPALSVSRLALALAEAGVDVGLWASDMSAAMSPLSARHSSLQLLVAPLARAMEVFGRPHVVHDNGIWLPHNHALAALAQRRGIARVVSTRGMLEPWAMRHKKLKKKLAWRLYQRRDLCRASWHHATADAEAEHIEELGLGVPVGVIPNGVDPAAADAPAKPATGPRTALFLGRIHPVKGLSLLLDAWARLRPRGWRLRIAGPDETGSLAELQSKAAATGMSGTVEFPGPLHGEAKERAFGDADLFILPSFSESFGMAVGEAFAHGLPVLTTTGVPWPAIEQRGCGWRVAPTLDGLVDGLRRATALDPSGLAAMGEKGREWVRSEFAWPDIAQRFLTVYESLLSQKSPV